MTGGTAARRRTVCASASSARSSGRGCPGRSCSSRSDCRPRRLPDSPDPPAVNPPAPPLMGVPPLRGLPTTPLELGVLTLPAGLADDVERPGIALWPPTTFPRGMRDPEVPPPEARCGVPPTMPLLRLARGPEDVPAPDRPTTDCPPELGRPTTGLWPALDAPPAPAPGPMAVGLPTGEDDLFAPAAPEVPPPIAVGRPTGEDDLPAPPVPEAPLPPPKALERPRGPVPPPPVLVLATGPAPGPPPRGGTEGPGRADPPRGGEPKLGPNGRTWLFPAGGPPLTGVGGVEPGLLVMGGSVATLSISMEVLGVGLTGTRPSVSVRGARSLPSPSARTALDRSADESRKSAGS